jgi:hypothetical protein
MSIHSGQNISPDQRPTVQIPITPALADVFVTIAEESSVISRTVPAVAFIENPPLWGAAGWNNVTTFLASCVGAYKVHIFPFGLLDPWNSNESGPTEVAPSLWTTGNRLVTALRKIRECDPTAPIILTLYGACWWMKGKLHASNGTTTLMTSLMIYAERYSAEGRVMINHLDDWLLMVDQAVQLAAAEGCRDFEVWNEAKGFYSVPSGSGQTWDARYEAGTADHADMGYSYFYKATSEQVVATMTGLGIARNQYRIGGPYPVLSTQGRTTADAISNIDPLYQYRDQWGYANKAPINFTREFLGYARNEGFEFDVLTLDLSTSLQDGRYPSSNPFDYTAKFQHVTQYWRDVLGEFGFDSDMVLDYGEIYSFPPPNLQAKGNEVLRAALWADCLKHCVMGRVRYPIMWGATGAAQGSNSSEGGLVTDPSLGAGYGTLTRMGEIVQYFKEEFGPGTAIYAVSSSDGRIDGLASTTAALLYNKSGETLTVSVAGILQTFTEYEVKLLKIS